MTFPRTEWCTTDGHAGDNEWWHDGASWKRVIRGGTDNGAAGHSLRFTRAFGGAVSSTHCISIWISIGKRLEIALSMRRASSVFHKLHHRLLHVGFPMQFTCLWCDLLPLYRRYGYAAMNACIGFFVLCWPQTQIWWSLKDYRQVQWKVLAWCLRSRCIAPLLSLHGLCDREPLHFIKKRYKPFIWVLYASL